jgi:hypothetical protein
MSEKDKAPSFDNTRYLLHFPIQALKRVALLLAAYRDPEKDLTVRLGRRGAVTPEWNPVSGYVFLIDQDFHVGLLNESGYLVDWWVCPCGGEGFAEAMLAGKPCCAAVVNDFQRRSM